MDRNRKLLLTLAISLFVALFYATAWVAEDAFITLRVVDNVWNGRGLTWNPGERIQVYTHPLWLLLLLPLVKAVGDPYVATLLLCAVCSLAAVFMLVHLPSSSRLGPWIALLLLPFSKAFVDYMSSGLENPLTYLLIGLFVWNWLRSTGHAERFLIGMLVASLLYLSRPDAVVFVALPCAWLALGATRAVPPMKLTRLALLGLSPALLWTAFSLFYYGSPIPNTALAKVGTGISRADLAIQAGAYLLHTIKRDPFTLFVIGLALCFGLTRGWRSMLPFALSLILWLLYLTAVGADYMEGRFLSVAFYLACCMLACQMHIDRSHVWAGLLLMAGGLLSARTLSVTLGSPVDYRNLVITDSGIADERGFYYDALGLRPVLIHGSWKTHPWYREGQLLAGKPGHFVRCTVGMVAHAAGPKAYWVDPLALTDGFLARLPARSNTRIGHAERVLPPGYLPALLGDQDGLPRELVPLFQDIQTVTRNPLFSSARISALLRLSTTSAPIEVTSYNVNEAQLPGLQSHRQDKSTCLGIPGGGALIWKFEGPPFVISHQRPLASSPH